jgi:short-subunit dehydrogenase
MSQPAGRTVLVTGASAGIGEALARVFAENGFDLVLVARREERLQALSRELGERFRVDARVLVADLSDPAAPARIAEKCRAGGRRVDALVNNAGYGLGGRFLDSSWELHARFIQVMVTAVTELTYRFLPAMIEAQYGRVINVASLAGLVPGSAGHTLYGAAKAFLIKFSQSVGLEVRRHNVHVTALCPGFTHTEFHDVSGTRDLVAQLPGFMWMDAETVARDGYKAVMRGDLVRVPGKVNRSLALIARLAPEPLVTRVMKRQSRKFRRV